VFYYQKEFKMKLSPRLALAAAVTTALTACGSGGEPKTQTLAQMIHDDEITMPDDQGLFSATDKTTLITSAGDMHLPDDMMQETWICKDGVPIAVCNALKL